MAPERCPACGSRSVALVTTVVASDEVFRREVLDIVERRAGEVVAGASQALARIVAEAVYPVAQQAVELRQTFPVAGGDKAKRIKAAVDAKVADWCTMVGSDAMRLSLYCLAWRRICREFGKTEYRLLPEARLEEVLAFIRDMPNLLGDMAFATGETDTEGGVLLAAYEAWLRRAGYAVRTVGEYRQAVIRMARAKGCAPADLGSGDAFLAMRLARRTGRAALRKWIEFLGETNRAAGAGA